MATLVNNDIQSSFFKKKILCLMVSYIIILDLHEINSTNIQIIVYCYLFAIHVIISKFKFFGTNIFAYLKADILSTNGFYFELFQYFKIQILNSYNRNYA